MKKETLQEIIVGVVGGLIVSVGMCMCLIAEWNLFVPGIVVALVGVAVLLFIIPIYKKSHPWKKRGAIDWGMVAAWMVGVVGALVMGFGMSKVMVEGASQTEMIIGIITGVIGLLICVLDYPVYAYIKGDKK